MLRLETKSLDTCTVLVVDDDDISRTVISTVLSDLCHCRTVASAQEALDFCNHQIPDVFLVDLNMPGMDGLSLCKAIKKQDRLDDIPLIFITSNISKQAQLACWEAGGNDFVAKPIIAQTLIHRVKNLLVSKLRMDALTRLTFHDSLTGLLNRNYIVQEFPKLSRQLMRQHQPLGIIMFDVDNFKHYNDHFGHLVGDRCLERIGTILKKHGRRARDAMIRYGGEEFLALLPDTDLSATQNIAQQIVNDVFNANIAHHYNGSDRITLSAGAASAMPSMAHDLDWIIDQADKHLYHAKQKGKNRVMSD